MTQQQRAALAILGVVVLAVALFSPWSPLPGARAPGKHPGDIVWRDGYPVGRQGHLAPPVAGGPQCHPLYRRTARPGHNRQCLIDHGWSWIANPPSEEGLG